MKQMNRKPQEILEKLKSLQKNIPHWESPDGISQEYLNWYGEVKVLLLLCNPGNEYGLNLNEGHLPYAYFRKTGVNGIRTLLTTEIKRLEALLGNRIKPVYGPGAQYDFFRNLNKLIQSAQESIFLIDPYINRKAFDLYLGDISATVKVRVLTHKYASTLTPLIEIISTKNQKLSVKKSDSLHDRVLFKDSAECWVIGQSIKDAADKKPTYLAPLPPDVVVDKLAYYEKIWEIAEDVVSQS